MPVQPTSTECAPRLFFGGHLEREALRSPRQNRASFGLAFGFFIAANGALFVRAAEIVPALAGLPLYLVFITLAALCSLPCIGNQLTRRSLSERPITVCVVGLLVTVILSCLVNLYVNDAFQFGWEFFKVVLYYLVFVGLVSTSGRLLRVSFWLSVFFGAATALAILAYHGAISFATAASVTDYASDPVLAAKDFVLRLRSTGIFQDPNDFCLVLLLGIPMSLFWLNERRHGLFRFLWLLPLALFFYALGLTYSRGGMIAFLFGVMVFAYLRFGWKTTLLGSALVLPLILAAYSGRQTTFSASAGTGQERLLLWGAALQCFKQNPLLGVGYGHFQEYAGQVAHNSFLHCFAELGFLGGVLFLGAFVCGLGSVAHLTRSRRCIPDPALRRFSPYFASAAAGYSACLFFLSNSYLVPTFMVLGMMTSYISITSSFPSVPRTRVWRLSIPRLGALGLLFLTAMYVFLQALKL